MDTLDLHYGIFVVNDRVFCLWDQNLKDTTLRFLDTIDPSYYEYLADIHYAQLNEEVQNKHHAAVSIRAAFSQGLETLFALIFAALQAPYCIPAWMDLYRNKDIYQLLEKIKNFQEILSLTKVKHLSWESISETIFQSLVLEDKAKEEAIKAGYGRLWSQFASTYIQTSFQHEYNSIKHGLRIKAGGFSLAIGAEDKPGVPAPPDRMQLIGKSKFGSSFLSTENIEDAKHHIQVKSSSRNWNPEDMAWALHLISMSIENIISSMKILNGVSAELVEFKWPNDTEAFKEPWKRSRSLGVDSISGWGIVIHKSFISLFTKDDLIRKYNDGELMGIKRLKMGESTEDTNSSDQRV